MNDYLRKECKMLKVMQGITYKELADFIEIKQDSFYSWLKGYYQLGQEKQRHLNYIISCLKED